MGKKLTASTAAQTSAVLHRRRSTGTSSGESTVITIKSFKYQNV